MRKYNVVFGYADNSRESLFVHAHTQREAVNLASKKTLAGIPVDFLKIRMMRHIRNYRDWQNSVGIFSD